MIYNLILAASHVFAKPIFKQSNSIAKNLFFGAIVIASTLMHLSDRKHNLPGVPFLNKYSKLLLNLDRLTALSGAVYVGFNLYHRIMNGNVSSNMIIDSICGLGSLFLSENYNLFYSHSKTKIIFHMMTHIIWHYYAFKIIGYF